MLFLVLSIICSTLIGFIFKGFDRWNIPTFQAIICNYWVCIICAGLYLGEFPISTNPMEEVWFPYAFGLGFVFVSGFFITALTIQKFGVTIGAIMQKMSILFSASFAIVLYNESLNALKIIGLVFALASIILTNLPNKKTSSEENKKLDYKLLFLPIYTIIAASIIEIVLQYVELRVVSNSADIRFIAFIFFTAACIGTSVILIRLLFGTIELKGKSIFGGILLGIPNFGSIYFLMAALGIGWEGSVVFPINNVAIIVLSTFLAILFLKEYLSKWNLVGVGMAILSIVLIAMA